MAILMRMSSNLLAINNKERPRTNACGAKHGAAGGKRQEVFLKTSAPLPLSLLAYKIPFIPMNAPARSVVGTLCVKNQPRPLSVSPCSSLPSVLAKATPPLSESPPLQPPGSESKLCVESAVFSLDNGRGLPHNVRNETGLSFLPRHTPSFLRTRRRVHYLHQRHTVRAAGCAGGPLRTH